MLDSFYDSINPDGNNTDQENVDYFVYYLTEIAGQTEARRSEIQKCFEDCDLALPSRLASYLSEGVGTSASKRKKTGGLKKSQRSMKKKFVKTQNGYKLERHYKSELAKNIPNRVEPTHSNQIIPEQFFDYSRTYLTSIIDQINISFEYGLYDACAVLMRRLMETLLIEIYIQKGISDEIKENKNFIPLERMINHALAKNDFHWNRNSTKDFAAVKKLGDVAAHDRTYITHKSDIEDVKIHYRRLIQEIANLAGLV